MARFTAQILAGENVYRTYLTAAATTDNDIGKPVKVTASGFVTLCDDGDPIYGFIQSVESGTTDGYVKISVLCEGRCKVELDGASAVGTMVEAAENTAVSVAKADDYGLVATKADVAADLAVDASGTLIAASVNAILADALLPHKKWMIISGAGTDGTTAVIESV